jgi:hypothetical protein
MGWWLIYGLWVMVVCETLDWTGNAHMHGNANCKIQMSYANPSMSFSSAFHLIPMLDVHRP